VKCYHLNNEKFDKLLLEAVDEALASLGDSVKQAVYFHLEKSFGIKKKEIPNRIRTFAQAVENIFGPGTYYLESSIMKRLYEKVGVVLKWDESKPFGFADYIAEAKRVFQEKNRVKVTEEVKSLDERARIIVVDDDEGIRKVLKAVLEEEGYVVDTAKNGKEAIEKATEKLFNLALIDIRLPDMEGTELLTKIKDNVPKMRKVIITGYPSLENAIEAVNKGADAYILKPFDMPKALKTIKEQLRKQQEQGKYSQEKVAEFIETRMKELVEQKNP